MWSFWVETDLCRLFFFIVCIYALLLEIQLSKRREGLNAINIFNPSTFVCLSQARSWIFNVICRVFVQWVQLIFVLLILVELMTFLLFSLSEFCVLCPMLAVSADCLFLIDLSVFSGQRLLSTHVESRCESFDVINNIFQ